MKTCLYNGIKIAVVEIDSTMAATIIKEMVEFWMDWEYRLEENDQNYEQTWLKQLTRFILVHGHPPEEDEEGWCLLDGSHHIKLLSWDCLDYQDDEIEIE
jgi:hypothetical protein